MFTLRKVRGDAPTTGLAVGLIMVIAFLLSWTMFGENVAFRVVGGLIVAHALYWVVAYVRTRNWGFLVAAVYAFCAGMAALTFPEVKDGGDVGPTRNWLGGMVASGILLLGLVFNKKLKWRGREILELAAGPVTETDSGYTDRPRPVGKVNYSEQELRAFAAFAARHLVALSYLDADRDGGRIILVPVMMGREYSHVLGLRRNLSEETYVAFAFDGQVTVHISRRDYQLYRDELSFDELCRSLGTLFIAFVEKFAAGEGARIVDQMNAVGLEIYS